MKYIITIYLFLFIASATNAQVKVFTGGDIMVGDTVAPESGIKMQVHGNSLFAEPGGIGTSAPMIRGNSNYSTEETPDYTWLNDDATGIFHPADDNIAFSIDGKEKVRISENGNLIIGSSINGNPRLIVDAGANRTALETFTDWQTPYGYAHVSYVTDKETKNWVVVLDTTETFFVYGDGNVFGFTYTDMSDSSLKENIQTLADAKSKILSLRGVSYNLKPTILNSPPVNEIGLIAQEVEQVVPEVVASTNTGIKGIRYGRLTALLIEGFKSLYDEMDSLKAQMAIYSQAGIPDQGQRLINPNRNENDLPPGRLDQNRPNPFSSETEIKFFIPENSLSCELIIFDMQGTMLTQYPLHTKGESSIKISANQFKAGMYLYSLIIDGIEIDTKRMILTN